MELAQKVVILRHRSLALKHVDQNTWLVVRVPCECFSFLRESCCVALDQLRHEINFVMTPPAVSKSMHTGLTNNKSCT